MRFLKSIIVVIACAIVFIAVIHFIISSFPSLAGSWEFREVQRIKSPDGQAEAVILTGDAGATTSTATIVLVCGPGETVRFKNHQPVDEVFWGDRLKNFRVVWKEPSLLEIQYDEASIYKFKNVFHICENRKVSYPVEIRLAPSSSVHSVSGADLTPVPLR